jgi:hypothetical protein
MPGESEDVEFTMQCGTDTKIISTAICVVTGGPEYRVTLTGESSTVGFALDKSGTHMFTYMCMYSNIYMYYIISEYIYICKHIYISILTHINMCI